MAIYLSPLPLDPTVSVIIPARNSERTLASAVESVLAQGAIVQDIVVAVGPSMDRTRELARQLAVQHERVRVVDNPSGRTPDALNVALAVSEGRVVVRVDAHAMIPPGYVTRAVSTLRETGAANVGGKQVPVAEQGFARAVAAAMASPLGSGGAAYRSGASPGPADTVYLGAFRREALDEVGAFDTRFTRNQDAELNLRLRRSGYVVWFDPALRVEYRPRESLRALARQYYEYGRWRRFTARIHRRSLSRRQLAAPILVITLGIASVSSAVIVDPRPIGLVAGLYVSLLLVAGAVAGGRTHMLRTALALGTMHLSWGIGFLSGPPRGADRRPPERAGSSAGNHGRA